MKPIVKICIFLSGILFLLGLLGITAGILMGVTPSQLVYAGQAPGRFSLRTAEEGPDRLEVGPSSLEDLPGLSGDNPDGREIYYEFRNIDCLDLDLNLCDLHVFRHPEDYIAVAADRTQSYFQCSQKGRTLILEDDRPASTKSNSMEQALIVDLYLPDQEYQEFCLEAGAGNVTVADLCADTIEIDTGAGSISIGALSCRELDVDAGVAEFTADSLLASAKADIDIGTGSAVIGEYSGQTLNLDCALGQAEVTAAGRESDYDYRLAAVGNICLNHRQQDHYNDHHGSHHEDDYCLDIQNGTGRCISIHCGLGNAELNFTEE